MTQKQGVMTAHDNPGEILGVPLEATAEEIRAAYLRKVREHPPDRSPGEFERIRDAYETLRDPRRRTAHLLFSVDPTAPMTTLLKGRAAESERCFTGPRPWLDALKET
ncbi:MAG: J domain-containing protein [bacterium]|nr:J domain-containing protein [bacterium]